MPRIVLIAEDTPTDLSKPDPLDRSLRKMDSRYVVSLIELFSRAGFETVHYCDPRSFSQHASSHSEDVVLSLWHGDGSRNAVAIVPAICETHGIRCIGADSYARVICDDKWLSRNLAEREGIVTPRAELIVDMADLRRLQSFRLPAVVKPAMGGMSMGVYKIEIEEGHELLNGRVQRIREEFAAPVIVEEFVGGRESMITMIGSRDEIVFFGASEIHSLSDETYFETRIFDAELKRAMSRKQWGIRPSTNDIPCSVKEACVRLFRNLGNIQYLRIDGRLNSKGFTFLELSPTPHFRPLTALSCLAREHDVPLEEMVKALVRLSRCPGAAP